MVLFCVISRILLRQSNVTAVMQAQSLFDPNIDTWANTLWTALGSRFTKERLNQVQEKLIILGEFLKLPDESFKDMIDRFKKIQAGAVGDKFNCCS